MRRQDWLTPSLPAVITRRAVQTPGRCFLIEVGGKAVSYLELDERADEWGRGLAGLGLGRGDVVCSMRRTTADGIAAWIGTSRIRAIDAGVAVSYRGRLLQEMLAKASAVVADADLVERIIPLVGQLPDLRAIVVVGDYDGPAPDALPVISAGQLLARPGQAELADPDPWDIGCLTHTSGTTGPSKGVLLPWGQLYAFSISLFDPDTLTEDDVFYSPLPMNHAAQRVHTYLMAVVGGQIVIRNAFSPSHYWADVRAHGCTHTNAAVGARVLLAAPPDPQDATVPLRKALIAPLWPGYEEFETRFGVEVHTMFGSTESGLPIISDGRPPNARTCGRRNPRFPDFEIRLVDEHDMPVPVGRPGELVVRTPHAWTLNAGYLGLSAESFRAWRNGWFHTGDVLRVDEDGWYYFVDRAKDSIRRRGENISSFEVEQVVATYPGLAEAAVVGVPSSDWGEDEVLAAVVPRAGTEVDAAGLVQFAAERLPAFMVPRYVRFMAELPRSETLRVQKSAIRALGVDASVWDRAAQPA